MKKILIAILFATICASLFMSVASADSPNSSESEYVYTEGNKEVHIEKGDMTDEQLQRVLYTVLGKEYDAPQVRNVLCSIFGHNLTTSYPNLTEHKVYASAPRCITHEFIVDSCSRCDYISKTETAQKRIYCCS